MKKREVFKKIGISILFLLVGLILYFFTLFLNIVNLSLLLPIFVFIHLILSILFSWSQYQKKYVIIAIIFIVVHGIVVFWNFPICGKYLIKIGPQSGCNCAGLIKRQVLASEYQCIGFRKKCYTIENTREKRRTEVSCQEMDEMNWPIDFLQ